MPAIQPVLGHKPITSYFPLVPNATKRKYNSGTASSASATATKRRRQTVITSDVQSSTSRDKEDRVTPNHVENSSPNIDASTRDLDWPYTPVPRKMGVRPPTPPTTVVAPHRSKIISGNKQEIKGLGSSTFSDKVATPFLKIPTTPARRPSRFDGAIKRLDKPCTKPASDQRNGLEFRHEGGEQSTRNVDSTIPSSQSQDIGIPEWVIDLPLPLGANNLQNICRTLGEEDFFVNSSQSQLLTLVSPGKRRDELLDPIPSSQSQERELSMPTICRNDYGRQIANRALPQMGVDIHRLRERTLLDESFADKIQPSILGDILSEGEKEDALETTDNVSETDTESESVDFPNGDGGHDTGSPLNPQLSITHDSSISQSSSPSADSYPEGFYSSLPPAVQDFREMFDNGDESYPVDFPESLRF